MMSIFSRLGMAELKEGEVNKETDVGCSRAFESNGSWVEDNVHRG